MNWKGCGRKRSCSNLRFHSNICLEGADNYVNVTIVRGRDIDLPAGVLTSAPWLAAGKEGLCSAISGCQPLKLYKNDFRHETQWHEHPVMYLLYSLCANKFLICITGKYWNVVWHKNCLHVRWSRFLPNFCNLRRIMVHLKVWKRCVGWLYVMWKQ